MLEEKLNCLSIKIVENDTKLLYKEIKVKPFKRKNKGV